MALFDRFKSLVSSRKLNVSSRFALLREAISGTMSSFYMARDLESDKVVGLKILDPEKTAFFQSRFKGLVKPTEGEIAIQLKHPRIVETFEHGTTVHDEQYLVMEFLDGPGMNSLLVGQNELLATRRTRYIRQAAESLSAVHAAGFIHRDVCPRNLILTDKSRDAELKLIDFGITVPATKPFMLPGNRTGTPNYMAPELVRRRATDKRLDVFAFGVTAYEMCSFELPWVRGQTGQAAMSHNMPPTDIRKYCPDLDIKLAEAIHSCIEPELSKRCPSIDEFLERIRGVKEEEPG
ncbi:MAG TPA: serine/threonine-protein kinase [Thermoguttaceae bacterium]|nr:serine/threonine-protein kinase [Thermoguttaceae bacterium]